MTRWARWLVALGCLVHCALAPVRAHVNSPYIVFEGRAGSLPVQVVVRQPDVVPGLASISVRVTGGAPTRVLVLPLHWNTDRSGAPRPDIADRVEGDPHRFTAALWLMTRGAYGIEVQVEGPGGGKVLVPVDSVAHVRKPMPSSLGWILAVLGTGLVTGVIVIAAAAAREATLPGGSVPGRDRWRTAALAAATATLGVAAMLYGGWAWWAAEDRRHDTRVLFRQFNHELTRQSGADGDELRLRLTDSRLGLSQNRLVPDHGRLIHLFLIAEEAGTGAPAFAHLHPRDTGNGSFSALLPELPAGRYRVFTELSHAAGMTQTLTNTFVLAAPTSSGGSDPDDAWSDSSPMTNEGVSVGDGLTLRLETADVRAGEPVVLKTRVSWADGSPAPLEPYLRMLGHAAILRDDGVVFAHLHPAGSLSMAATRVFAAKLDGESGAAAADANCGDLEAVSPAVAAALGRSGEVGFPYVFPSPGRYFVWIQVRISGRVRTAPFEVHVAESATRAAG